MATIVTTTPAARVTDAPAWATEIVTVGTEVLPVLVSSNGRFVFETCHRCGGSGNFSYCPRFGTVCFQCQGQYDKRTGLTGRWADADDAIRRAKRRVADRKRRATKAANAEAAKPARQAALVAAHPVLAAMFGDTPHPHYIVSDMAHRFTAGRDLSDKQITLAVKLVTEHAEAEARRAAEVAAATPAPTGKGLRVAGEVVSVRSQDNGFRSQLKMLVKTDAGWKLWVSVPTGLGEINRGNRVEMTVDVTPSDDDPLFAFGKRPRLASVAA